MDANEKHAQVVFFIGYIGLLALIGYMLWPYLSTVIFAIILAGIFNPLKKRVEQKIPNTMLASLLLCVFITLLIFLPSIYLGIQLSREALHLYEAIARLISEGRIESWFLHSIIGKEWVSWIVETFHLEINPTNIKQTILNYSQSATRYVVETLNSLVANIFSFFFHFFMMIVVIFAVLANDQKLKNFLLDLSPLPDEEEELMIQKFNQMNQVTFVGNGIGGIIQGLLAGIGFWVAGIDSLVFWTTVMIILAFIPLLGMSIIYIPASIYLVASGDGLAGLLLFLYCTLIAVTVENWFKPIFVGKQVKIDSTLVFLSIIGGMSVFGIAGIFYGPIVISLFLTFVELYHKRFSNLV